MNSHKLKRSRPGMRSASFHNRSCCVLGSMLGAALFLLGGLVSPRDRAHAQDAESPEIEVTVAPMAVVRERPGITGAGWVATVRTDAAADVPHLRLLYPNHPDNWGKSTGTGASISRDGGRSWTAEPDNTPLVDMVDQWTRQLADGSVIAIGIRSVPDPKTRTNVADNGGRAACVVGHSADFGASWKTADCRIECPAALGVIARPLPPILEDASGTLFMPAYAWSSAGSRALLLASEDRGLRWTVRSTIVEAAAIRAAGVPVTTPWLETSIARTADGGWLAAVRTGSSARATLMQTRSADGRTWDALAPLLSGDDQQPVAGKLPSLLRLGNGMLVLLTAHTQNHCRIYISPDGAGRRWSKAYVVTSQSGGNTCLAAVGDDALVVVTPANGRLYAWPMTVRRSPRSAASTSHDAPTNISVTHGPKVLVRWNAASNGQDVAGYRVTPRLIAAANPETQALTYAPIEMVGTATQLDVQKVVSIGGRYRFMVEAIDRDGGLSPAAESDEVIVGLQPNPGTP
ncbi:MAG: hypothetical protein C0483_08560 [Pirellula sp.]|nr:hypothetical protein [Pirellula sp.]